MNQTSRVILAIGILLSTVGLTLFYLSRHTNSPKPAPAPNVSQPTSSVIPGRQSTPVNTNTTMPPPVQQPTNQTTASPPVVSNRPVEQSPRWEKQRPLQQRPQLQPKPEFQPISPPQFQPQPQQQKPAPLPRTNFRPYYSTYALIDDIPNAFFIDDPLYPFFCVDEGDKLIQIGTGSGLYLFRSETLNEGIMLCLFGDRAVVRKYMDGTKHNEGILQGINTVKQEFTEYKEDLKKNGIALRAEGLIGAYPYEVMPSLNSFGCRVQQVPVTGSKYPNGRICDIEVGLIMPAHKGWITKNSQLVTLFIGN